MRHGTHASANRNWNTGTNKDGKITWEQVTVAVLCDIREELRGISQRLDCAETLAIPRLLRAIKANTTKRRKKPCRK